jgi:hypothetical protein
LAASRHGTFHRVKRFADAALVTAACNREDGHDEGYENCSAWHVMHLAMVGQAE